MESFPSTNPDHANLFMNESAFNVMVKRSEFLARSQIIPKSLQGKPADIMVIFMMAMELDIPPMQALNGINVIQGKPTISPQLMLALIKKRLPNAYIKIVEAEGEVECTMARDKSHLDDVFVSKWNFEKAKKMGLVSKDNYQKQLNTMLRWRAVGEAARIVFPDIISGTYLPDEFQDGSLNITSEGELVKDEAASIAQAPGKDKVIEKVLERNSVTSVVLEYRRLIKDNKDVRAYLMQNFGDIYKLRESSDQVLSQMLAALQELTHEMILELIQRGQ